ncbi:MAG: NAD(+) synthase [Eggerthellaceae bacterium]
MENSERYRLCVNALKGFMDDAGFSGVVIGLSGRHGLGLVAVMCADALGADRVHGVSCRARTPPTTRWTMRSIWLATSDPDTVSIAEPYRAFEAALAEACGGALGLAAENTQARCRMVCLMALSNAYGWMLVNTGNKSEAMMGYSTLYGDTAGAFAPIGGLYKTDVFAVARWRNRQAEIAGEVPPIPEHVFVKPPSAELSPDQEDEKSMGIDYPTLDRLLKAHGSRLGCRSAGVRRVRCGRRRACAANGARDRIQASFGAPVPRPRSTSSVPLAPPWHAGLVSQSPLRRLRDGMSAPHDKTFSRHYTLRAFVSVSVAKEVVRRGRRSFFKLAGLSAAVLAVGGNPRRMRGGKAAGQSSGGDEQGQRNRWSIKRNGAAAHRLRC